MMFRAWMKAFFVLLWFCPSEAHSGCFLENLTVSYSHKSTHFTYEGEVLPILLEGSAHPRPLQDFLNNIVKLIGTEILGYADIDIVVPPQMYNPTQTSYALERLSGCPNCENRSITAPSINMATWMSDPTALEGWPTTGSSGVMAQGNHALYGRYGWHVSSDIVRTMWEGWSVVGDHWRSFQDSQYITALSVSGNVINDEVGLDDIFTYCLEPECIKGIFYPPWCNNATTIAGGASHTDCALLLADYPELSFHMITSQILELHLNVKVGWVGHNLHYMVTRLVDLQQPVLFFTLTPNDLLHYSTFSRVSLPACPLPEVIEGDISIGGCDCPWHPITKMVWSVIDSNAPPLSSLVQSICIDDALAEDIFSSYLESGSGSMEEFTCQWLQQNHDVWLDWMPAGRKLLSMERLPATFNGDFAISTSTVLSPSHVYLESESGSMEEFTCQWLQQNYDVWLYWMPADSLSVRRQLYLPGLFPTTDEEDDQYGIYYGATMAIQAINKDCEILFMVELNMVPYGTLCRPETTLDIYSSIMQDNTKPLAGFLGPACSTECDNLSGFSQYFNQVIISYYADSQSLAAKDRHPFVFRVFPDSQQMAYATERIFSYFGWSQFALISEEGVEGDPSTTADYLMKSGMNCLYCQSIGDQEVEDTVASLIDARPEVIILHTSERLAQELLCQSYQLNLYIDAGYIWIIPSWYPMDWWDLDRYNLSGVIGCSTNEMKMAVSGALSLTRIDLARSDDIIAGGITMLDWEREYTEEVKHMNSSTALSMGAYAYDAAWTFAFSLQKLMDLDSTYLDSIQSDQTSMLFREILQNTSFPGATGRVDFINQDRRGPITILVNLFSSDYSHQEVLGRYKPTPGTVDEGELYIDMDVINILQEEFHSFNDHDEEVKVCAIEGIRIMLGSSCASAFVVVCLLFTLIFLVMALSLGLLFKKKYDRKVKEAELRMKELGLFNLGMDSLATLDKWEVPRENVILNRKLGEGAFGTVYGGQALLEGQMWDAVAVKTLKMGSSIEEKLDFLCEAEMMKRFDHKNIVRLRGVCTHGEPLYAVMDFMLYGDLKTFLLARRHLVGQECDEAEVLHPIRLTAMVHDIVSGLDYLAQNKYVHRDLACRNCLVDASCSVKIGDFGMTRALYDSDYYRLCKQGRLPIRWMAPESVSEGLFTLMSDIWSLGVVIYEIVTFGGFPYSEMSNFVVFEYIKNRNSMTPPDNCPSMLASLMMQCWVIEASVRPTTAEILDLLEANQELIVPCVSKPHESISVDGLSVGSSFSPGGGSSRVSFRSTDQSSLRSSIRFKSSFGSLRKALENSLARKRNKRQDQSRVSPGLVRRVDIEMGHELFKRQGYLRNSNRSEPSRSSSGSKDGSNCKHESIQRYASFDGVLETPTRKEVDDEESFECISRRAQSFEKEHIGLEFKHRLVTKARSDSAPLIPKKKTSQRKTRSRSIGNNDSVRGVMISATVPPDKAATSSRDAISNIYVTNY